MSTKLRSKRTIKTERVQKLTTLTCPQSNSKRQLPWSTTSSQTRPNSSTRKFINQFPNWLLLWYQVHLSRWNEAPWGWWASRWNWADPRFIREQTWSAWRVFWGSRRDGCARSRRSCLCCPNGEPTSRCDGTFCKYISDSSQNREEKGWCKKRSSSSERRRTWEKKLCAAATQRWSEDSATGWHASSQDLSYIKPPTTGRDDVPWNWGCA